MAIDYSKLALPKGKTRKQLKSRKNRTQRLTVRTIHELVFRRERNVCRICGRPAFSMHEIRPRSVGGKISLENSVALCGSGTTGCHGLAQTHQLRFMVSNDGAQATIHICVQTRAAAEYLQKTVGHTIISPVFQPLEC